MGNNEQNEAWIQRVESLVNLLEGSSIGELELVEAGTEIIIRRQPHMIMVALPTQQIAISPKAVPSSAGTPARAAKEDRSIGILAPLTGVYYASPSPTSPPFVSVGDIVNVGQVVALVEAMKVFNEIQAEASGRVVALVAQNGNVVQKGDVLLRIEPA